MLLFVVRRNTNVMFNQSVLKSNVAQVISVKYLLKKVPMSEIFCQWLNGFFTETLSAVDLL